MKTVLIAEDEPAVLAMTSLIVEAAGFKSIKAANGLEAMNLLDQEFPDVLVTDIRMPGMNGFELALTVRKRSPYIPIIMMSGYAGMNNEESLGLFESSNVHFLPKPFTPSQVTMLLQMLLAQ